MVSRVFVEKRPGFDGKSQALAEELREVLGISGLERVRVVHRYDCEGISAELFERAVVTVFSEPTVDVSYTAQPDATDAQVFAVEFLPGQFDQRADSAAQCIQLLSQKERPEVRTAELYYLYGSVSATELAAIKSYIINPVEAREASFILPETLALEVSAPEATPVLAGFRRLDADGRAELIGTYGLAMDTADVEFCQRYFAGELRDPTLAELRVIDTYWSDHCRHTTFGTHLDNMTIDDAVVKAAFERYLALREELGRGERPLCLMDMGTIGAKALKASGKLCGLDESEEINACTVKVDVDVNGKLEPWLFLFKNETHNHPTEIEPFGGAATCIGGAIRDPLSGRSYVYQAMRVTGAADPTLPFSQTLAGKLPQRKIVQGAAEGYSSYGNQIGLATGQVTELYHPGYVAKRMEIGAVVGATPASHVRRETPAPGDKIVLLGGRTGRDGIGGATGSSKAHKVESLETAGAEVQKGNTPEERKLQRLFRRKDACRLIKRCNDFGAGGVSVAVGELADGLSINLDAVPKKYNGLNGVELAISESQERMAVALAPEDVETFLTLAESENLEATVIATVTAEPRVRMSWQNDTIVDLSRAFLASNGAPKHQAVHVPQQGSYQPSWAGKTLSDKLFSAVSNLNVASQKGLSERFDSTIGAATVLMPFGGATQLTPAQAMVAKLPVEGETSTISGMAFGFNPYLAEKNQFTGAYCAVVESLSKLVASGFSRKRAYLTFQEYFERLRTDPVRWGKPVASVLGALDAQLDLEVGAIGGKDSMSGSFEELDVPPTLVSFAVATGTIDHVVSPEFKQAHDRVIAVVPQYESDGVRPRAASMRATLDYVEELIQRNVVRAAATPGFAGVAEQLVKMCFGNRLGLEVDPHYTEDALLKLAYGSFIVELADSDGALVELPDAPDGVNVAPLGVTTSSYTLAACGELIDLTRLQEQWEYPLEGVFPYHFAGDAVEPINHHATAKHVPTAHHITRPRVIIPVFPGTNCEFDSAAAFAQAGADPHVFVVKNRTPQAVMESCERLAQEISQSQIVMLPGGFSGGDEPDGSAKFIAAFFRAPQVKAALEALLAEKDGLLLGICNGFQALVKLGLLPYGRIVEGSSEIPTLTHNTCGRHQSRLVTTRVCSNLSPWLSKCEVGDLHTVAISHGEGRFMATPETLDALREGGQIAFQYTDAAGQPSMDSAVNPNGSLLAIEGITSADGRILGKMGHSERTGAGLYQNVPGNIYQPIFEGGVDYFA